MPVLTWIVAATIFFRDQLASRFDKIMGEDGDARLVVLLHEHWFAVIRGHEGWIDPRFFHPTDGVLGYADTVVLNSVLYVPLRAAGVDPFLAFQWTLIGLSAIGFAALYVVLRRHLHVRPAFAAGGCVLYFFANNVFIKVGHPQLLGGWWTPVCALAGLVAATHPSARVRLAAAASCGLLASLIVYSSFYVGWTSLFAATLLVLGVTAIRPRRVLAFIRRRLRELAAAACGALVGAVPFALTYLPVLEVAGGRTYEEVQLYAPRPGDVLNVSSANYLWGAALRGVYGADAPRLNNGELILAVTPLLMLFTLSLGVLIVVGGRRHQRRRAQGPGPAKSGADAGIVFACLAAAAAVALIVLPMHVEGRSLWQPIWAYVPGASAVRAVGRVQLVASQLVAVSFSILLSRGLDLVRARRLQPSGAYSLAASALLALALIEQLNLTPSSRLDRSDQQRMLKAVPAAPPRCSSFFVTSSGPPVPSYIVQIDAMLIAYRLGLPTVNGYSGQTPKGWMLNNPQDAAYLDQVRAWSTSSNLPAGLCAYERTTQTWDDTPFS